MMWWGGGTVGQMLARHHVAMARTDASWSSMGEVFAIIIIRHGRTALVQSLRGLVIIKCVRSSEHSSGNACFQLRGYDLAPYLGLSDSRR